MAPTIKDTKEFESKTIKALKELVKKREADGRTFRNMGDAGAYLTHDLLGDRELLTDGQKLVMAYGKNKDLTFTLEDLNNMAKVIKAKKGKFDNEKRGIPINVALTHGGEWGKADRRSAKAIKAATLYKMTGNILDFRVTSSGETPNAPAYYKTRVRLEGWLAAVSDVKKKNYLGAAQQAVKGHVSFDCNCGRYIYFYQYLATIGNFDIAPGETVFPKIRNKKLEGICCKHILKVLTTLQSPLLHGRIATQMQITAKDKDFQKEDKKTAVHLTQKEMQELEKAGKLSASQAEMKRFATSVKAHLQKLQEPKTKAVQKEQDKKMEKVVKEKQAKINKLEKDVMLAKMGTYLALKIYRDKVPRDQAVADYAKDAGISLAEAQDMNKSLNP